MRCLFISHPEVVVDPSAPVTQWRLSEQGQARAKAFALAIADRGVEVLCSSSEQKAIDTAAILGATLGVAVDAADDLGENDRSATGFLPPAEFERTADRFFARPDESVRGWETASDAQRRIVRAVRRISSGHPDRKIALVAHGAVGSLLLSDLLGVPISRDHDQPRQGCWFALDPESWTADGTWRPLPEA